MSYDKMYRYIFIKNGVYYFERRVPRDLLDHYSCRKICYSLRTRSPRVAVAAAERAAAQLDDYWYHLRVQSHIIPGQHLLKVKLPQQMHLSLPPAEVSSKIRCVCLSEAVGIYLNLKDTNRTISFRRSVERSCAYVIDLVGDKQFNRYSKADANHLRDHLFARGLAASSVTRIFTTIRAVFNLTVSELDLQLNNPFARVYYDRTAGVKLRHPLSIDEIKNVQRTCFRIDDDLRWLVALISDTGLRLAEAAGLSLSDINLENEVPHLTIREHPWRRLKTASSSRVVPLVGASLWGVQRLVERAASEVYAFPRYNATNVTNSNSASAALNKWLKAEVGNVATVHSFRHSMRDRLRAVECPADIVDQIGGWTTGGVGHSYGTGYPLEVVSKWVNLIQLR